jgi:hypothetical protein
MGKSTPQRYLGAVIALGAIWGLSEAALGMGLRTCAAAVSGSVMTGVALFFMAAGWAVSKKLAGVGLMVLVAVLFKMSDALLLSLPLDHGAIGNPIFAFVVEAAAFVALLSVVKERLSQKPPGQAIFGGLSAVLAANLFPLVRYATGVPACVVPGTGVPLSLHYIHVAALTSMVMVPLGMWAGSKIAVLEAGLMGRSAWARMRPLLAPAALLLGLALLAALRLA